MPEKKHIQYPIGYNTSSKDLIHISAVSELNRKKIICLECKENFVAVRNHNTPHFKHKPNTKCIGNFESYIHWITKEIFRKISEVEIPEILISDLTQKQQDELQNQVNNIITKSLPLNRRLKFKANLKKNLSESRTFQIQNLETEKEYKTLLGNVRVDIVLKINNQELFIEPFYTSKIDELKKRKLNILEKPTIEIDLLTFVKRNNFQYNLNDLKKYLISKYCKYWICIREHKVQKYIENYLLYVSNEIKSIQNELNQDKLKLEKIQKLERRIKELEEKIRPTQDLIWELRDEIIELKKELGIRDFTY